MNNTDDLISEEECNYLLALCSAEIPMLKAKIELLELIKSIEEL